MNPRTKTFWAALIALGICAISGIYILGSSSGDPSIRNVSEESAADEKKRSRLDQLRLTLEAEERLLELTPLLSRLSTSVKNLQLLSHRGKELFASEVAFNDLVSDRSPTENEPLPSLNSAFQN